MPVTRSISKCISLDFFFFFLLFFSFSFNDDEKEREREREEEEIFDFFPSTRRREKISQIFIILEDERRGGGEK